MLFSDSVSRELDSIESRKVETSSNPLTSSIGHVHLPFGIHFEVEHHEHPLVVLHEHSFVLHGHSSPFKKGTEAAGDLLMFNFSFRGSQLHH